MSKVVYSFIATALILVTSNSFAATIVKSDGTVITTRDSRNQGGYISSNVEAYRQDGITTQVGECSDNLYVKLGILSSTGDRVCEVRQDDLYQRCVIGLTRSIGQGSSPEQVIDKASLACASIGDQDIQDVRLFVDCSSVLVRYFGNDRFKVTGMYCAHAQNYEFASCVGTLSRNGVTDGNLMADSCNKNYNTQLAGCVATTVQKTRANGNAALNSCREQIDPELRRQAEIRRQEEARRQAEARARAAAEKAKAEAAAAARAAADAKAKSDAEAKRKADEAKKNGGNGGGQTQTTPTKPTAPSTPSKPATPSTGGVGTTPQPQNPAPEPNGVGTTPAPAPAPQPAPQDPSDSGGGVIVDLPSF